MTAKVIDGVAVAAHIRSDLKSRVSSLLAKGITPGLAVIVAGADPASAVYVRNKIRACAEVSIKSFRYDFPADTKPPAVLELIQDEGGYLNALCGWCDPDDFELISLVPAPDTSGGRNAD